MSHDEKFSLTDLRELIRRTVRRKGFIYWIIAESGWRADPFLLFPPGSIPEKEWLEVMRNLLVCRGFNQDQVRNMITGLPSCIRGRGALSICIYSGPAARSRNFPLLTTPKTLETQFRQMLKQLDNPECIAFSLHPENLRMMTDERGLHRFRQKLTQSSDNHQHTPEDTSMGKSTPTFRELVRQEAQIWGPYKHALAKQEKVLFEKLFNKSLFLSPAAGEMAGKKDPLTIILMNLMVEMENRMERIENELLHHDSENR